MNGYRFFLIGHLHEAEEESQQWQDLHNAIRKARRDYIHNGTTPDWESLATQIATIRETLF